MDNPGLRPRHRRGPRSGSTLGPSCHSSPHAGPSGDAGPRTAQTPGTRGPLIVCWDSVLSLALNPILVFANYQTLRKLLTCSLSVSVSVKWEESNTYVI